MCLKSLPVIFKSEGHFTWQRSWVDSSEDAVLSPHEEALLCPRRSTAGSVPPGTLVSVLSAGFERRALTLRFPHDSGAALGLSLGLGGCAHCFLKHIFCPGHSPALQASKYACVGVGRRATAPAPRTWCARVYVVLQALAGL